ncbi:MAG: DUF362 domain-containing protein [Chloroflexi bacterium]|nr:DUF362 domain-containing protein [Chloroflexota bacterium]
MTGKTPGNGPTVALARACGPLDQDGIRDAVYRALDLLDYSPPARPQTVAIKPNLRFYWDYSTGETTDPRVVAAVIDYVRERWNPQARISVVESDASAMRTRHVFPMLGYDRLAAEKGIELVNLSEDEMLERAVHVGRRSISLPLPRTLHEVDLFISCPKLKVGPYAGGNALHITCTLKNLYGCIGKRRKVVYHPRVNEVIVAVNKQIGPHLHVVDGIVALGKQPVRLGLIIAGSDAVAVDSVAARVMGYNPAAVKQIRLAEREGVGTRRDLVTLGEDVRALVRAFPKRTQLGFKLTWRLQLALLRTYARLTGDAIPPALD